MKRLSIILIAFFLAFGALAQSKEAMRKIESARIALITERLGLTPEQAEKFWPVYREYEMQQRALRKQFREARKNIDMENITEEQGKELMQIMMDLKQKELNLEKEYSKRLTRVISTQQLLKLRAAEKDFQRMLLKRLQHQRDRQMQNRKMMERREMFRDRRNN